MTAASGDGVVLVTGGAGFVGSNVAADWLARGHRVRVLDDLSRPGVERNWQWLRERFGGRVELARGDVAELVDDDGPLRDVDVVYHFAAQVAVTTSLDDPALDFRSNLLGTFRLLEALRSMPRRVKLVFASTNKVYGDLEDLPLCEETERYTSPALPAVDESRPLAFHTPYGCSKGGAEQYVLDYARSYGIPATVLRMSCIYGHRQCGSEDQGWVAHFLIRALENHEIQIFGDGKQVRDILWIDDLVAAQRAAVEQMDALAGVAWNIGGGLANAVSLREVLALIEGVTGAAPVVRYRSARAGDQRYYVSDHGAFSRRTGWQPRVGPEEGVRRLHDWLVESGVASPLVPPTQRAVGGA